VEEHLLFDYGIRFVCGVSLLYTSGNMLFFKRKKKTLVFYSGVSSRA